MFYLSIVILGAEVYLSTPDESVIEGDLLMTCANFGSLPLQRNVSIDLAIPDDSTSEFEVSLLGP